MLKKTTFKRPKYTYRRILIVSIICFTIVSTTVIWLLSFLLLPCSSFNYNRIEIGMTMDEVKKILGNPHNVQNTVNTQVISGFDTGNPMIDAFLDGVYDGAGLTPPSHTEITKKATYYYFDLNYALKLQRFHRITDQLTYPFTPEDELEKLTKKAERLGNRILESPPKKKLTIKFDENQCVKSISLK